MNRLIVGVAVALATLTAASHASAADMPVKAPRVAYDPCGVARFNGFYVGGNIGAVAYTAIRTDQNEFIDDATNYSSNKIGSHRRRAGRLRLAVLPEGVRHCRRLELDRSADAQTCLFPNILRSSI